MSGEGDPGRDRGLQPERTGLAALRTAMVAVVVALLCLRSWTANASALSLASSFAAGATAAGLLAFAVDRTNADPAADDEAKLRRTRRTLLVVVSAIVAVAVFEFVRVTIEVAR